MPKRHGLVTGVSLALLAGALVLLLRAATGQDPKAAPPQRPHDAVADAQTPREVPLERPEQQQSAHDRSDLFAPDKALPITEALNDQKLFFGKAQCSVCHPAPFYLDQQMHDLHLERFLKGEAGDGPIKSFTLRGIKDSPPYLHDGRCLTLEDTVEFFNLVLELKLTPEEKKDLVAFMRQL
jgi:cytochrome c peroxidase